MESQKDTRSGSVLYAGSKAVALSIALGVVIAFLPPLSLLAVPAMPIPAAFITSRYGVPAGLLASLLVGLVCVALTGLYAGLLIFLLTMFAGIGAGFALRRGVSQFRLFATMALMFCATLVVWLGVLLLIIGETPVAAMQSLADATAEPSRQIYQAAGMSQQEIDTTIADARDFATALPYVAPAVLLAVSILLSGVNLALERRVFDRLRQPFPRDFVFREFRVHWAFAYMMIAGLACQLVTPYTPDPYSGVVDVVGANLFIAAEVLFFIQGLAVASFFLWSFKLTRGKRVVVYACLFLLQATLSLTSWMGLFDTWLDYRRRFARKKAQGG